MQTGHEWHRALGRFFSQPTVGVLTVMAIAAFALYAMVDTDALARAPAMPVLFQR